ncbi:MAG: B12-binding domain-containing radical SAM protein [Acidobacteria bacterium]|nr:B12-binding domain-containing radical SAM protein [Acidobacteriota bacterium]MCB9397703.1 B12-binding domain-containing radical SAM protein [Acidobacteriota bacterium]
MKVLLAHSFYMALDAKQAAIKEPFPPLGTLIAAGQLRQEGFEVDVFDAMVAAGPQDFKTHLAQSKPEVVVFFEDNFNWLSKMCLAEMRQACFEMLAEVKARGLWSVVVGSDASDFPELFLKAGADYVIKGEGEWRLIELLKSRQTGPGVFTLSDGLVFGSPPEKPVHDLSRFALPAWDLVDLARYRAIWHQNGRPFTLNMMTTRGCPYRCNWCAKPIHGRRYDIRPANQVVAEMQNLKAQYAVEAIWFSDDIFGLNKKWLASFCAGIQSAFGSDPVPYKIQIRADLIQEETADWLARSGCREAWMGVESGSQKILDAMDKDLNLTQIENATRLLKKNGIRPCFFLQFGYPGEEAQDIHATWQMVKRLKPEAIGISVAYPLPNTPFFEKVKDLIENQDHWQISGDMQPIFKATYPRAFYPLLYRYIHLLFCQLKGKLPLRDRLRFWQLKRSLRTFQIEGIPF